jgi:hypothetical protein
VDEGREEQNEKKKKAARKIFHGREDITRGANLPLFYFVTSKLVLKGVFSDESPT